MINLLGICQSFSGKDLFQNLEWSIKKGRKYGLVGLNGSGKTTLLETILGTFSPEKGSVSFSSGLTTGYLPQLMDQRTSDLNVLSATLLDGKEDAEETSQKPVYEAEKILFGLGFTAEQLSYKVSSLSGGWKMRVELARILLRDPNVLMLDEPTNHLDINSIEWFEEYLKGYRGTVVLVSHDKYLLDRMVDTIVELEDGKIREFRGNYSSYLEKKEQLTAIAEATAKNQQKKLKAQRHFIERFRYKASKAKQVQSRIKMLEKMEPQTQLGSMRKTLKFNFPVPKREGRVVCEISDFSKEYRTANGGRNVVFRNCPALKVQRGDKIALVGRNGEGKTTLCRMIVGRESFMGASHIGHNVALGYYAQNQDEMLDSQNTVYDEFISTYPLFSQTEARTLLGSFLFTASDITKRISVLSGGEKSRLSLLKILVSGSNFLVLDEPTNHLDMESKEVLCRALEQFAGTFLLISHDRYFVDRLVTKVWNVQGGSIETFIGNYSEFLQKKARHTEKTCLKSLNSQTHQEVVCKSEKILQAQKRNLLYRELREKGIENMENWKFLSKKQMEKALCDLESKIFLYETKKVEIEKFLANPQESAMNTDWEKKTKRFSELEANLRVLYARWDEITEYLQEDLT